MKIKRVKWKNHPILGNLELDFINTTSGEPFNNILFAGENGTGKTAILESISNFLNLKSFEYFECIEYLVDGKLFKARPQPGNDKYKMGFYQLEEPSGETQNINTNRNNSFQQIEANPKDIRHYGCVFSKARADFKTETITHTTTKVLDSEKYSLDNEENFTSLKQLIVDIQNQDDIEYRKINQERAANSQVPMSFTEFYKSSKIHRFQEAFNNFFDKIKYYGVEDNNGEKRIGFKKRDTIIGIDNLSTGEKQIVFRGAYLLRNVKKLNGAAIMIDEPELSMHPKWQERILKFYKDLFRKSNGVQNAQLFFATHSDHVLKEALLNKQQNIVIILKDIEGEIRGRKIDAPSVLPSITNAETNYLAFDIVSNDYHIELYGHLQNKKSKNSVKSCDDYIKSQPQYNASIHSKNSTSPTGTTYSTLSTYIRNAIDHPEPSRRFTDDELRRSIELLIELCR